MKWNFRSLSFLLPGRISGQIALLILASVLVIHVVLTTIFYFERSDRAADRERDQLPSLIELIAATPAADRGDLIPRIDQAFPHFDLTSAANMPAAAAQAADNPEVGGFAHRLGPHYQVLSLDAAVARAPGGTPIAVRLPDGGVLTARLLPMPMPFRLFGPFSVTALATAVSVTLLGLWAAWGLTGPLRRFAWAAENFSPTGAITLLPERGPYEIRTVARALNQMRERIKSLVDDRTRMLAAVSHDLRTPITRLRLRCEFIEDQTAKNHILDELAHMNAMVESVLHFLRDGERREQATMIDLATSLQAICDQFADTGHDVRYDGPDHVVVRAYAGELQRAITNLVDNAVRHGGKTDVHLSVTAPTVTVAIADDGPGIPDAEKAEMFEPFVRGDLARGMNNKTGFGLGLSIARTVIEAHRGTLTLIDRKPRGLIAEVTLPQAGADAAA